MAMHPPSSSWVQSQILSHKWFCNLLSKKLRWFLPATFSLDTFWSYKHFWLDSKLLVYYPSQRQHFISLHFVSDYLDDQHSSCTGNRFSCTCHCNDWLFACWLLDKYRIQRNTDWDFCGNLFFRETWQKGNEIANLPFILLLSLTKPQSCLIQFYLISYWLLKFFQPFTLF